MSSTSLLSENLTSLKILLSCPELLRELSLAALRTRAQGRTGRVVDEENLHTAVSYDEYQRRRWSRRAEKGEALNIDVERH